MFFVPIFLTPNIKENGGVMHTPCGHINHFWESVSNEIEKLKGCSWQREVEEAAAEVDTKTIANHKRYKNIV